jgi:hypothetical protein
MKVEAALADDAEAACADASREGKRIRHGPGTAAYLQQDAGDVGHVDYFGESSALQFCQDRDVVTVVFGGRDEAPGTDSARVPHREVEQSLLRVAREVSDRLVNASRISETPRPRRPVDPPTDLHNLDACDLATPDLLRRLIGRADEQRHPNGSSFVDRVDRSECSWSHHTGFWRSRSGRESRRYLTIETRAFSSRDGHSGQARADLATRRWMKDRDAQPLRGNGSRAGLSSTTFRTDSAKVGFTMRNVSVDIDFAGQDYIDGYGEVAPPAGELRRHAREAAVVVAKQLQVQMDR